MALLLTQAVDDKITFKFNIINLNGKTLSSAGITSTSLSLSNISNDSTSFTFTVDSTGVKGSATVDVVLTLSNGDIENKCIKFTIGTICF